MLEVFHTARRGAGNCWEEVSRIAKKHFRILLINDGEKRAAEIERLLKNVGERKYSLITAEASSAVEAAGKGEFDAILIHCCGNEKKYREALKNLRRSGTNAPVIMVAENRQQQLELKAKRLGADELLAMEQLEPLLLDRSISFAIERKKAEEALKASEELYKALAKSSPIGIWHISKEGYTIFMNEVMCRLLEIDSPKEIKNNTFHSFFTRESRNRIEIERAKREQGIISSYEGTLIGKKGTRREVMISGGPLVTADGKFHGSIGTFSDITERKKAELKLREMKETAEEATLLKDKFMTLLAHDLRGPLGTLRSYMRLIRENESLDMKRESLAHLDAAIRTSENMLDLISNLLDVSRFKTGELKPKKQFFNARLLVLKVIANMAYPAERKGITIEQELSPKARVYGDTTLLEQVFQNLVANAIKFCMRGDRIKISVTENESLTFCVRDSGIGVEPERIKTLFSYETKTSTTGTAGEVGSGLGLPLCRDIMEAHDGTLTVESEVGKGSAFFASLPIARPTALIIESQTGARNMVARILKDLNVKVMEAEHGEEALRLIKKSAPDLVIADLLVDDSNGCSVIQLIRQEPNCMEIPIIVLLGEETVSYREMALNAGANDFITKPFLEKEIAPRIRLHIG